MKEEEAQASGDAEREKGRVNCKLFDDPEKERERGKWALSLLIYVAVFVHALSDWLYRSRDESLVLCIERINMKQ